MNKKFFLFGMIALLGASLFFLGCPTDSDDDDKTPEKTAAEKAAEVGDAFGDEAEVDGAVVKLTADKTLSAAVTIPSDVTLAVTAGKTLTVATGGSLTVNGTLSGGAGAKIVVEGSGTITGGSFFDASGTALEAVTAGVYYWNADAGGEGTAGWKLLKSGTVGNVTVSNTDGTATVAAKDVVVSIVNDTFVAIDAETVLADWITNLPAGLTAKAKTAVEAGDTTVTITVSGTSTVLSGAALAITIPAGKLAGNAAITVTPNADATFAIVIANVAAGYSLRETEGGATAETETASGISIESALKDADGKVTIKLSGTFGGKYVSTISSSTITTGSKWESDLWGTGVSGGTDGTYGAVNIRGLFTASLDDVAIQIKPYPGIVFYTAAHSSGAELLAPVRAANADDQTQNLYIERTEEALCQKWKLYTSSFATTANFGILLNKESTDRIVKLDIDQYAPPAEGNGAYDKVSDILSVTIDYSDVDFPDSADTTS
jgi:hypothetical protein